MTELHQVAPDLEEIGRLNARVTTHWLELALPPEHELPVTLALEEILVNVIRFGHPEGGQHEILVWLSLEEGYVIAIVEDDGVPFNPLEAPEPDLYSPIETRPIGGLGIHLVRNITDGLEYRRNEGRNRLVMRKQVPRSE